MSTRSVSRPGKDSHWVEICEHTLTLINDWWRVNYCLALSVPLCPNMTSFRKNRCNANKPWKLHAHGNKSYIYRTAEILDFLNFGYFPHLAFSLPPSGTTFTALQLVLKFAGLAYIPAFTKIYQSTLDWFPGFIFTLSSILTVLGMIPIR